MTIYPAWKAQIILLLVKKVTILAQYLDFANIFLRKLAKILPKQTVVNEHNIKLVEDKEPSNGPIYKLSLLDSKLLKSISKLTWPIFLYSF